MIDSTDPLIDISSVSDEVIRKAVEIRCSECYWAMAFTNAVAGSGRTALWDVLHSYSISDIAREVHVRGLSVDDWYQAVGTDKKPIPETTVWQSAAAR